MNAVEERAQQVLDEVTARLAAEYPDGDVQVVGEADRDGVWLEISDGHGTPTIHYSIRSGRLHTDAQVAAAVDSVLGSYQNARQFQLGKAR